ncbi:hypothetical protein GCM10010383_55510 [Streptomyces lomondensis]|uniref:Uncharacterized protein n=1 Tax=Streptomyces lomondensis TaxID=68229 RepID=A0ABQ2XHU1_9ACTN|nr:hypothetical protein GCM10010383_55510 [Streptomyces lomondensis]
MLAEKYCRSGAPVGMRKATEEVEGFATGRAVTDQAPSEIGISFPSRPRDAGNPAKNLDVTCITLRSRAARPRLPRPMRTRTCPCRPARRENEHRARLCAAYGISTPAARQGDRTDMNWAA